MASNQRQLNVAELIKKNEEIYSHMLFPSPLAGVTRETQWTVPLQEFQVLPSHYKGFVLQVRRTSYGKREIIILRKG
jgi:hypothetical protein